MATAALKRCVRTPVFVELASLFRVTARARLGLELPE
jgi:hypothetical protein